MITPAHPGRMLCVNIPVVNLGRSKAFFAQLGFTYNPMFTDDDAAACMLVGEQAIVMLLSREKFAQHAKLPIADPTTHSLALFCFSVRGSIASSLTSNGMSKLRKAFHETFTSRGGLR